MGEVIRLTTIHDDLALDGPFLQVVRPGWPMILSALKSLLETGEPLSYGTSTCAGRSLGGAEDGADEEIGHDAGRLPPSCHPHDERRRMTGEMDATRLGTGLVRALHVAGPAGEHADMLMLFGSLLAPGIWNGPGPAQVGSPLR